MTVRGDLIFRKTGDTSWDYFINPSSLPDNHPLKQTWPKVQSQLYGAKARARWLGSNFTFVVESPQKMYIIQELASLEQVVKRRNANEQLDVSPATGWDSLLEMLYPGENIQYTLKPVDVPVEWESHPLHHEYISRGVLEQ
jgi:hypothetical protein